MESSFNALQQQQAASSSGLTPPLDELLGSSENGETPSDASNKRSRIWAACETCRSRKARCNGEHPCSACEKRARSSFPKDQSIDEGTIQAKAREICVFDWNRKPRGPKAKARDPSAPAPRSKKVKLAEKGAPRSEKSAGSAYVAAQGVPKLRTAGASSGALVAKGKTGRGYEDTKSSGVPAYGEAGGSNWQSRAPDGLQIDANAAVFDQIRLSSAGPSKPIGNSLPRLTWVSGPAADEISDPRDALASLRGSGSSTGDGDLVTPWPMPAGFTHNLEEGNRQLAMRQEASLKQAPRAHSACVLDRLMENLQSFYAADDWFLIALSVAQWSDLDVTFKSCPARYIFGQANPHDGAPPTPPHVQLALLALLANRALLFPTQYSDRELAFAHPQAPAELARWGGRLSSGKFSAPLRDRLKEFSRRSSSMANSLMLNLVAEGHVDPTVLHTGYLISWLSSEDGMSSSDVHDMRAWLFHIIRAWKLYLLDVPAEIDVSEMHNVDDPPGAPQARRCDARYMLQDPIEREGIRRVIIFIRASYLWSRTADSGPVPSSFYHLDVAPPMEDDFIHLGSAWNPPINTGSNLIIRVLHMSSLTAGRVTLMLNTPLEDLFNGRGPEPDLQRAIDEIEATLNTTRALTPIPKLDGSDFPCLISGFLNLRVVDFLCYRLFLTLTLYQNFTLNSPQTPTPTSAMRAGTWISPAPDTVSFHEALIPPGSADALAEAPWPAQPATLRFSRNPSLASLQPLFDVDDVVSTTLELLDRQLAAERASGLAAMGAQPHAALTSVTRGMRLPLHLQRLCAGACAMAAEIDASLDSWGAIFSSMQSDASWEMPDIGSRVPPLSHPQRCSKALWGIGERLVRLIYALARDGNEYARNIAVKAEMYHTERMAWVAIRQQAQTDNAARVGLSGHAGSVSGLSGHASSEDGRMSLP